ncbi:Fic family protein [Exiguobacterium sp. USCH10]|uniref:Fic family protein n=1 Tax=Exiguobacterium sp. USCH10 TaxID=3024839 RepID=UPI0030B53E69
MDFPYFYRMYYEKSLKRNALDELKNRLTHVSTQTFPFDLYIENKNQYVTMYFMHNPETTRLMCAIYEENQHTQLLVSQLPGIAQSAIIRDVLAEELFHTNEIEGVKSTKEQFVRSARLLEERKEPSGRFTSLIKTYYRLIEGEVTLLNEAKDLREFYDFLVADEIEEDELPDGKYFRKERTYVYKSSKAGKPIHTGMVPEQQIIQSVESLIHFLNSETVPILIRVAVAHYYFGYIHPFYDGNGRTSRFISSLYLKQEFHTLTALSLSRACNLNRAQYLEAFEKTNDVSMQGEMNFFVDRFLSLFLSMQKRMNEELTRNLYRFEDMKQLLQEEAFLSKNPKHRELIYILSMHEIFSEEDGMLTPYLIDIAKKSPNLSMKESTIRATLNELVEKDYVEVEKVGRFNLYTLTSRIRDQLI